MKKLFTILAAVLISSSVFAQAPQLMSYQSVIRDGSNVLVINTQIEIQISILQGSNSGTAVYVETHLPTTNLNGLATIEIGGGTIVSGTFNTINWGTGPYFLKTEIDPDGTVGGISYTIIGTSQLLSVPYALHSERSDSSSCCNNQWHLLGNSGTTDSINFLGTTDNIPFNIRVNNQKAGRIDHLLGNTFFGFQSGNTTTGNNNSAFGMEALFSNVNGNANVANGYQALYNNTSGSENTAIGFKALNSNTTANNNTATGSYALYQNTTGDENSAHGYHALYANTIGIQNTASGAFALYFNTTGSVNTAIGYHALGLNTTGSYNNAFGFQALNSNVSGTHNISSGYLSMWSNTTGYHNAAYGSYALNQNLTGYKNTALGYLALFNTTVSSGNTAVGTNAGDNNLDNGNNNTFIGFDASAMVAGQTNSTAIGYNAKVSLNNSMVLGGTGSDAVNVGVGTTAPHTRFHVNGSFATVVISKNSAYTLGIDDNIIAVTGITTISLPTAVGISGRHYTIKRMDAANATTVGANGIETIDGAAIQTINTQYAGITVVSDGANWIIVAKF